MLSALQSICQPGMRLIKHFRHGVVLVSMMFVPTAFGQSTLPAPPKIDANNEFRLRPASDLVRDFSKVRLIVTDEANGRKLLSNVAPLYRMDDLGKRVQVGTLPVGTEVKVERISSKLGRNYYGYFVDEQVGQQTVKSLRWVDGLFLKYEWIQGAQ